MKLLLPLFFAWCICTGAGAQKLDTLRNKVNKYLYANEYAKAQKAVLVFLEQKRLTPQETFYAQFLHCNILKAAGKLNEAIAQLDSCQTYANHIPGNNFAYRSLIEGDIAECYFDLQNYNEARDHALKSVTISPDTSLRGGGHAVNYLMLGYAEYLDKSYSAALAWYNQALETYTKYNETCELPLCYTKMARVYNSMQNHKKAEELLQKSVALSDSCRIENYSLLAKRTLYEIYKENKNYEKAVITLEEINGLVSKLDGARQTNLIAETEIRYKTILTRKENEALRKIIQEQKQQLFLIIGASILLCILLFFLIRTMRKHQRAKKDLENLNAALEQKVRDRTEALNHDLRLRKKLEKQLNEKINDMETLISKLSHDIRSPIANVLGLINVANIDKSTSKEIYFEKIQEAARRLDSIIKDLTSIMYVTNMKEQAEIIDFNLMVNDTKANLAFTDNMEHIQFEININQTRDFHSDPRFLVFIMQNLLENAVKYSNRWESLVKVNVNEDNKGIVIEVIDNGIGIDAEFHEKIFDMFFRATNFSKGSGLGLYIVKHAVEKLKGKIEIQSQKRVGTTFKVFLPDLKRENKTAQVSENVKVT